MARIYDPRRAAIYQRLGIATVATVAWTTERVLRRILPGEAAVEWIDPSARVSLVERTHRRVVGRPPAAPTSRSRDGCGWWPSAGSGVAQVPNPDLVAQDGDVRLPGRGQRRASADVDATLAAGPAKGGH